MRGRLMKTPAYRYVRASDRLPMVGADAANAGEPFARVKLFNPSGSWTWYLTEYDPETGECFGLVDGFEEELGYFNLNEIAAIRGQFGLPVERDLHWRPRPLADCYRARRSKRASPTCDVLAAVECAIMAAHVSGLRPIRRPIMPQIERIRLLALGQRNKPADCDRESPWCESADCDGILVSERDWRSGVCVYCRADAAEGRDDEPETPGEDG